MPCQVHKNYNLLFLTKWRDHASDASKSNGSERRPESLSTAPYANDQSSRFYMYMVYLPLHIAKVFWVKELAFLLHFLLLVHCFRSHALPCLCLGWGLPARRSLPPPVSMSVLIISLVSHSWCICPLEFTSSVSLCGCCGISKLLPVLRLQSKKWTYSLPSFFGASAFLRLKRTSAFFPTISIIATVHLCLSCQKAIYSTRKITRTEREVIWMLSFSPLYVSLFLYNSVPPSVLRTLTYIMLRTVRRNQWQLATRGILFLSAYDVQFCSSTSSSTM